MIDTLDFMELMGLSPKDALVKIIASSNMKAVDPDFIEFGTPEVIDGRVTKVRVSGRLTTNAFEGLYYKGSFEFRYKRLDLAELFAQTKLSVQMDLPCKTSDLIAVLSHHYGYKFDSSDYINEIITVNNAYDYVLKAAPYSLRWVGEIRIPLLKKESLSELTTVTEWGVVIDTNSNKFYPQHNKHFVDGRYFGDYLKDVVVGPVAEDTLLGTVLQRLYYEVGDQLINWQYSDSPAPANLKGATVTFNGRTVDLGAVPYVFTVSRALRIELDESLNTGVAGPLVVNYNTQVKRIVPDFPENGYRFPAELWAINLDGTAELAYFETLYEDTIIQSLPNTEFMDRILNVPLGSVTCSPTPSQVNLFGARVEYLGRNVGYPESVDPRLTLIWVLVLDTRYSTYLGGRLMIHYTR